MPNELPTAERDGEYGVLFMDEVTTASVMQVQPAMGLCDDSRMIGDYKLPEHWIVVAAGNGPNDSNFQRLDDAVMHRFRIFDAHPVYEQWRRDYAHQRGIREEILAYLNFKPEDFHVIERKDYHKAGKMAPEPRTWTRLSDEWDERDDANMPVSLDEMTLFVSTCIGEAAARRFTAFMEVTQKSENKKFIYDIDKIIKGTEKPPAAGMPREIYHLTIEQLFARLKSEVAKFGGDTHSFDEDAYKKCANVYNWILQFTEIELVFNSLCEARDSIPEFGTLLNDGVFTSKYCPDVLTFFEKNANLIVNNMEEIENLKV